MAPETLERQLSPALEQLSRFWTLRRSPWVEEARRGIRAADKQTAQVLQQKTALSSDLERHRAILSQLQSAQQQLQAERDELDARHQALTQTARACRLEARGCRNKATVGCSHRRMQDAASCVSRAEWNSPATAV